jgi:hypothetical protein
MLLSIAAHFGRRQLRRLGGDDAVAWAIRIPLVTLVVAAALALLLPRSR